MKKMSSPLFSKFEKSEISNYAAVRGGYKYTHHSGDGHYDVTTGSGDSDEKETGRACDWPNIAPSEPMGLA
jgi:hypothetical protein